MYREQWLHEMTIGLRDVFAHGGKVLNMEEVRLSCGLPPSGAFGKKRAIGICFCRTCSEDGVSEIFISPTIADAVEVGATIVHEVCHHLVGVEHGHKTPFKRFAWACGLEGKATSTVPGPGLIETIERVAEQLGPYPHRVLTGKERAKSQATRMKKLQCPVCGYIVRTTKKWAEIGLPTCPCTKRFEIVEAEQKGGDE